MKGYGAACAAGLEASAAEVVVMLDCDASVDPTELPGLVEPVLRGELDLVVGRRGATGPGAYPLHLRIANRELARRTGTRIVDCGRVRVARRQLLLDLQLRDRRSGSPAETVVRAAAAGHRIGQQSATPRRP